MKKIFNLNWLSGVLIGAMVFMVFACAGKNPYIINLMPAPGVYSDGYVDPFADHNPIENIPYTGVLFATDRAPTDEKGKFYQEKRGNLLRLGVGQLEIGKKNITWEEARQISLLKNRSGTYPLKITSVEEFGIIDSVFTAFTDPALISSTPEKPGEHFAKLINEKLAISKRKDIYIYVHGYKVVFTNPLLVSAELWHFLGYEGVFVAYAWPSIPKRLAYASDLETTALSAHFLQLLLEFLSENTDAENIHIVGYSAGTRVVITTLFQLALLNNQKDKADIQKKLRIGNVILVGSDVDRQLFGAYLLKGLLDVPKRLTVYASEADKALSLSRRFFRRGRLGQILKGDELSSRVIEYFKKKEKLVFINVTGAKEALSGNGHSYFRRSPWVSSDILMTLMYDLKPEDRGLVKLPDLPIWKFPKDYNERLAKGLKETNPDIFK